MIPGERGRSPRPVAYWFNSVPQVEEGDPVSASASRAPLMNVLSDLLSEMGSHLPHLEVLTSLSVAAPQQARGNS